MLYNDNYAITIDTVPVLVHVIIQIYRIAGIFRGYKGFRGLGMNREH